jgi:hypothetical protein
VTFELAVGYIVRFPVGALKVPCVRVKAIVVRSVVPAAADTLPSVLSISINGASPPFELYV